MKDDLLVDELLAVARREGLTLSVTEAGSVRLAGPESVVERLAPAVARLRDALLSRLSRPVPPVRDRKTRVKTKAVPAVPAVPAKNGIIPPVPDGPEDLTQLKIFNLWIIKHETEQWERVSSFTPPASQADAERWYPRCECVPVVPSTDGPPLDRAAATLAERYLDRIGEDDPAARAEYLAHLAGSPDLVALMVAAAGKLGIPATE